MGTDPAGLRQAFSIGQANGRSGAEGIPRPGGILHLDRPGRTMAPVAPSVGIDRTVTPHGDNQTVDAGRLGLLCNNIRQSLRGFGRIIRRKQDARFLLITYKAIHIHQKIPALQGDIHVGYHGKYSFFVFFRQTKYPLHNFLIQVNLNDDAVRLAENLIALLIQDIGNGREIRALGNGGHHIPVIVKNGQPRTDAVGSFANIIHIYFVAFQLAHHILPGAGFVHQAQKRGPQLTVGHVLCHIAANAAMNLLHSAHIAPGGIEGGFRISLNVHKNGTNDNNSHCKHLIILSFVIPQASALCCV